MFFINYFILYIFVVLLVVKATIFEGSSYSITLSILLLRYSLVYRLIVITILLRKYIAFLVTTILLIIDSS